MKKVLLLLVLICIAGCVKKPERHTLDPVKKVETTTTLSTTTFYVFKAPFVDRCRKSELGFGYLYAQKCDSGLDHVVLSGIVDLVEE